jgi:hypothetical protein
MGMPAGPSGLPCSNKILVTEYILTCPVALMANDPDEGPAEFVSHRPAVPVHGTRRFGGTLG